MIGGTVLNTIYSETFVEIKVIDDKTKETASFYAKPTDAARCVQKDDTVWKEADWILWTPKMRYFHDYKLERAKI